MMAKSSNFPSRYRTGSTRTAPSRQRGAVLYVALIMLILIALLGIAGMQMASLQERMVAGYGGINAAFQNAENTASIAECYWEDRTNSTSTAGCAPANTQVRECDVDHEFNAGRWARDVEMSSSAADRLVVHKLDRCMQGYQSSAQGRQAETGGPQDAVYQISAYATDREPNPGADAAVSTVFIP
ncbi:PilX N-terminal domain-containing pilus assembly protein [Luteimonas sp. e5]